MLLRDQHVLSSSRAHPAKLRQAADFSCLSLLGWAFHGAMVGDDCRQRVLSRTAPGTHDEATTWAAGLFNATVAPRSARLLCSSRVKPRGVAAMAPGVASASALLRPLHSAVGFSRPPSLAGFVSISRSRRMAVAARRAYAPAVVLRQLHPVVDSEVATRDCADRRRQLGRRHLALVPPASQLQRGWNLDRHFYLSADARRTLTATLLRAGLKRTFSQRGVGRLRLPGASTPSEISFPMCHTNPSRGIAITFTAPHASHSTNHNGLIRIGKTRSRRASRLPDCRCGACAP